MIRAALRVAALAVPLIAAVSCGESSDDPPGDAPPAVSPASNAAAFVVGGLSEPVFIAAAPGDSTRLFIVE